MSCQFVDRGSINILEPYWPQIRAPSQPPSKRPKQKTSGQSCLTHHDTTDISDTKQSLTKEPHDTKLKYALLFARWSKGLAKAHSNCKRIPVVLVLTMAVRMISYLRARGMKISKEILATTFWVALKFYSSRDTIPNASFMGMVTNTPKSALILNEPAVLVELGWNVTTVCTTGLFTRGSKKNSTSVPEDLQRLAPEQGLSAVDEVTVVPNLHPDVQQDGPPPEPPGSRAHVYFKDLSISIHHDDESEEDEPISGQDGVNSEQLSSPESKGSMTSQLVPKMKAKTKHVHRQKLVIILVGLPARGKTFLCNKLMCYFNWLGHPTKHINVGMYRRKVQGSGADVQDSSFFDPTNEVGNVARHKALCAALEDMERWLAGDEAQVAILDATNSTSSRRNYLRERLHGRFEYMFLESICEDEKVLEENYRLKMKYSPDYRGADMEDALRDFKERINNYESVYETIADRTLHYVKLINMVTGRGYMDVNRISGYIPGKMVFYLMQICKALGRSRKIWLTRHGQSLYNVKGKIGGNSNLSTRGAAYTHLLPAVLASRVPSVGGTPVPVAVWTSTLNRTIATASNLPYPKVRWKALDEIQSGVCDGMTYADIKEHMPEEHELRKKDKLRYRYPSGESYMDVIQRLEPVVIEVERDRECICIVAHQAVLRALYGYFMNRSLEEVPHIDIPLHTLIELTPKADGTMAETRFRVDVDKALQEMEWVESCEEIGPSRQLLSDTESDLGSGLGDADEMASSYKDGGFRRSLSLAELAEAHLVTTQQFSFHRENDRM